MAKEKNYEIELKASNANGAKKTMYRGGRRFEVKQPQVLSLTDEQVEVFNNDSRFKVQKTNKKSTAELTPETASSETEAPATGEAGEETPETNQTDETSEDSGEESSEEDGGQAEESEEAAPTVDELVRDNGREELNAKAGELGVENPENLANKQEVAQAIVDAQAGNSSEATE